MINFATGHITGTAAASAPVEVYLASPDPTGLGEARTYVGSAVSNGAGQWNLAVPLGPNCYTAFVTVGFIIYSSSEFGPNTCWVFAPVVLR